jgi:hypothetical protein
VKQLIQFEHACDDFRSFFCLLIFLFRQVLGDQPPEKEKEKENENEKEKDAERCGREQLSVAAAAL